MIDHHSRPPRRACLPPLLPALALVFLGACRTIPVNDPAALAANSLVGQIWDVRAERAITPDALLRQLAQARYILLGEVHDNPAQHRIQAEVLDALLARGVRPALAMEQFDLDHQAAIDAALAAPGASSDSIADAGRFDRKGWGWALYEPLIGAAIKAGLPIAALNLSRGAAQRVASDGFASLGQGRTTALALDQAWDAGRDKIIRQEINDGHCGQLPERLLPQMVAAQRARDASMADALVNHIRAASTVAILGRGHARRDLGVPFYLGLRVPDATVISIGLIEVEPGQNRAADYSSAADNGPLFDYLWFTPDTLRDNPCGGFLPPARSPRKSTVGPEFVVSPPVEVAEGRAFTASF